MGEQLLNRTGPGRARRAAVAVAAALCALVGLAVPARAATDPSATPDPGASEPGTPIPSHASPFDGTGMWIYVLSRSSGGRSAAIAEQARRHRVTTVFVKAAHGDAYWPQFSPRLVSELRASGLRVCAYQRLLGRRPAAEAAQAVRAARTGADCLVIDAETEYERKHAQARTYVRTLRRGIGSAFPVGLTSFPLVDLHPTFPYSVFLGPGGAQYNLPQMYWRAIGTSVDRIFARTYRANRVFGRPIRPLGQVWQSPAPAEIRRFRELAAAYGATGVSWWSWQTAGPASWEAIGRPISALRPRAAAVGSPPFARDDSAGRSSRDMSSAGYPGSPLLPRPPGP